jgi:hypothetical protein
MSHLDEIAADINALPPCQRSGTLRIWGDWFGRPLDNVHACTACCVGQDHLVLLFDAGEELHVWNPAGVKVVGSCLIFEHATRVRWEWYSGLRHVMSSLQYLDYALKDGQIQFRSGADWKSSHTAISDANAVVLVSLHTGCSDCRV